MPTPANSVFQVLLVRDETKGGEFALKDIDVARFGPDYLCVYGVAAAPAMRVAKPGRLHILCPKPHARMGSGAVRAPVCLTM